MASDAAGGRRRYHAFVSGRLERVLLGDWSRVVRDPIDLLRGALIVGAVVTLAMGEREQALRLALTFLVVLVPRLLDVPRPFDLAFNLGMAVQAWGNVFGAFQTVTGYDKIVHFILPCGTSALLYLILIRLRTVPNLQEESGIHVRAAIMLITFAFGVTVGALYECYEYFAVNVLDAGLQVGYADTITDLLDDAAGSLLGGALLVIWDAYGWGTRRRVPAQRIR